MSWNEMISLRGGYKSLFANEAQEGLTLGAGLRYRAEGVAAIEVNYAFSKFGLFGNLNTISVTVGLQ